MIPMNCPQCGSYGEVPLDRLNSRMTCKKCKAVFYMDMTGHIVLGDPREIGKKKKQPKRVAQPSDPIDLDFRRMIQNTPKPVRIGAVALAAGVLIFFVSGWLVSKFGAPKSLDDRATYVGGLFVDNKPNKIKDLATPDSQDALDEWYSLLRPAFPFEGPRRGKYDVIIGSQILGDSSGGATTFTTLKLGPGPASTSGSSDLFSIEMRWVNQNGTWLIDGQNTLQVAKSAQATASR